MAEPVDTDRDYFFLAFKCVGECVSDMATLLRQGITRPDAQALRGNVAVGLERAASYVRGQPFVRAVDPQHAPKKEGE